MPSVFSNWSRGVAALAAAATLSMASAAQGGMGADNARHLLARTGFNPAPLDVAEYARLSPEFAVDQLLRDARSAPTSRPPAEVLEYERPANFKDATPEERKAFQQRQFDRGLALRSWWLAEMLATPSPLTERMTLFWHNHFVSGQQKVRSPKLMYEQNLLLRSQALGNFAKLLHAVGKDPAMIVYLDSASNRRGQPNENFAREVMELFTLGEGHYSERDIKEAARAFTGWSIEPDSGAFRYRPNAHDEGDKTVFGKTGRYGGDEVLDLLLARRETADFIAAKLWREFVSPAPANEAEKRELANVAAALRDSGYEIKPALRVLFLSKAFWAKENRGVLIKSPVELVVGTLRGFEVETADTAPFAVLTAQLGQNLFSPPNVRGWLGGEDWINSSTLLARKQFADRLFRADDGMPGSRAVAMLAANDATADEKPRAMLRTAIGKGTGKVSEAARQRLIAGMRAIHFDARAWLADVDAAKLDASRLALAVPPVQSSGGLAVRDVDGLRALVLDPAYQLK